FRSYLHTFASRRCRKKFYVRFTHQVGKSDLIDDAINSKLHVLPESSHRAIYGMRADIVSANVAPTESVVVKLPAQGCQHIADDNLTWVTRDRISAGLTACAR